jgi:hypothetical protein
MRRVAFGARSATTPAIHAAPSALTREISWLRSVPTRSKKPSSVFLSRPTAAHTSRPESWSTTMVR